MEQKQTYPIVLHFLIVPTDKDRLLSVNYLNFKGKKMQSLISLQPTYRHRAARLLGLFSVLLLIQGA
jgi:hypothetical protein